MCQDNARQGRTDRGIDPVTRSNLDNTRNAIDQLRFRHLRTDGKVERGILQQTLVFDAANVQCLSGLFQRDRYTPARDDGLKQFSKLFREIEETN